MTPDFMKNFKEIFGDADTASKKADTLVPPPLPKPHTASFSTGNGACQFIKYAEEHHE